MKIVMVTSSYPKFPGDVTAPFIESIAKSVAALGHEVHVLAPWHPDIRRASVEDGVVLHFFKYAPLRALNIWGYAESLEADVRVKGAIYPLTPVVMLSSFVALMKLTRQIKFDVLQAHWVIPNGPVAAIVARLRNLPLVVSMHGSDVFVAEHSRLLGFAARHCYRAADQTTAPSDDLRLRAVALGASPRRSQLIPYGVDPCSFTAMPDAGRQLRERLGIGADQQIVLTLGRLVRKKGFEYLIQAAPEVLASNPNTHIYIVGAGDLEAELKGRVRAMGLEGRVHLPGKVAHTDTPLYLSGADVFVLPSVVDRSGNVDGLPNVLLEAMASGRPVVASEVAGIPLAVQNGGNGLLVPEKNPHELALAINRLLASPELRARFGEASRRRIEDDLNWDHVAHRFEAAFAAALARRERRNRRRTPHSA